MHSSLGFHTITLSILSWGSQTKQLTQDFVKYSQKERNLQMYPNKKGNWVIKFYPINMGIKWEICRDVWINGAEMFFDIINVTINPKILADTQDYITATTYQDMKVAVANFNHIIATISPLLENFDCYKLKRIDYCINFDLSELAPDCSPELIMNLIRRSSIPTHYKEWTEYDTISHRRKSRPSSFYLVSKSVIINCYSKYMQLQERSRKNEDKGYPPILQSTLDAAKNIIRFEVQCMYHKTYTLSNNVKESGNSNVNKFENLLSNNTCIDIIVYYFNKIIMRGDWYTLQEAVRIVKRQNYNCQKEKRLIDALELVNQCRSLAKAKTAYRGEDLEAFKRTIKDLTNLKINPVTIPREWGIKYIPNLLYTYFDKVAEEKSLEQIECFRSECLKKTLATKKERKWLFSR